MKVTFLGQGFTEESPNSIGVYINKYLADDSFSNFYGISAFASPLGIKLLDSIELAKKSYSAINLIVGVDQNGTSKEALEEILKLDVNSYVFYQKEAPIFHPKIYLFEGKENTCLIIGSSNLTGNGLFCNIESSFLIQFQNDDPDGLKIIDEIKSYFKSLFDFNDPNLFKLDKDLINAFVKDGIVPSESFRSKRHGKKIGVPQSKEKRSTEVPVRPTSKIPWSNLKSKSITAFEEPTQREELELTGNLVDSGRLIKQLIWESGPLVERDLNIPTGSGTNATGSMLFKKGKTKDIDQRHFFRDEVFNSLNWVNDTKPNSSHIERTSAIFQIIIKGKDKGIHPLALSHNTKTDSASYRQNNSMTSLHWGEAKSLIANRDLIGSSMKLFKQEERDNFFIIEII